jgi:hypothetical protein
VLPDAFIDEAISLVVATDRGTHEPAWGGRLG